MLLFVEIAMSNPDITTPSGGEISSPAIRYHGGKYRLAPWILAHFPTHRIHLDQLAIAAGIVFLAWVW